MIKQQPKDLAEQAVALGYERISFERDWEITLPVSVRNICLNGIAMALAEGSVNHAKSLEVRLPAIKPNFQYKVGRLANGCQTVYIGP